MFDKAEKKEKKKKRRRRRRRRKKRRKRKILMADRTLENSNKINLVSPSPLILKSFWSKGGGIVLLMHSLIPPPGRDSVHNEERDQQRRAE